MVDVKLLTKSGKEKNLHKKVFSSSYFIQNDGTKYIINNRTLIYIKGAIKSLIGFPQIIRKFVKKEDQKNWYYYLYIDRYLTKPLNKSKCVGNDMYEIKLLEIIWNLVDILIKTINSNKELYSNIIIWSFYNKEQDTELGHKNFYGTMIRYLPFYDKSIDYVIIKNCRTPVTPLDLLIQIDFIDSNKDYSLLVNSKYNYNFSNPINNYIQGEIEKQIKANPITDDNILKQDFLDKSIYLRFIAALLSFKVKDSNVRKLLIDGYQQFEKNLPNSPFSNYEYSVDEFVFIYFLPYHLLLKHNTYLLETQTANENTNSMTEYLYNIYSQKFTKQSQYTINQLIYRLGRGSIFPLTSIDINPNTEYLECKKLPVHITIATDEIKPLAFGLYYKNEKNDKYYKYNYKDLDISNFRQKYSNNYNWLTIGADSYIKNFDWKHNYDKIAANKFGKILPNDELNFFVSKNTYKPYEMLWLKLYFIDLTPTSDNSVEQQAQLIFNSIKNNMIKNPMILSIENMHLFKNNSHKKTAKRKTSRQSTSRQSNKPFCTIKKL